MDLNFEHHNISNDRGGTGISILKRKVDEDTVQFKKLKTSESLKNNTDAKKEIAEGDNEQSEQKSVELNEEVKSSESPTKVAISPKKRLELPKSTSPLKSNKKQFIYGNYSQYYNYRNKDNDDQYDIRFDTFVKHQDIFKNKHILDIGCNSGLITMEVAKRYNAKSIIGLDIDKSLIKQATKILTKIKKSLPMDNELRKEHKFPFNITFVHGNYILKNDVLLEIERPQYDVILCLSITKWIHLNFGDKGLKQAFKRMFLQLKPQGKLILEAQSFQNYSRRKKITDTIYKHYKEIKFLPNNFTEYLLSSEVGFSKVDLMGVPDHSENGFKRPIQIFSKS